MTAVQRPAMVNGRSLLRRAADVLLPPVCLACQRSTAEPDGLCAQCWRSVHFITAPFCDRLGSPLPYETGAPQVSAAALAAPPDYDRARAAVHYMSPARDMIARFKYLDQMETRGLLAGWLATAGHALLADAHVVVPVPLFRRRLLWRRFNQSAELARDVARYAALPYAPAALARLKNTPQQVGLTAAQRADNVRGAFKVPSVAKPLIDGRHVLLIDDVITTGATVNACARALRRAGAARVDVLAVAMATEFSRAMAI